jgi:N-methylhydantoinase A
LLAPRRRGDDRPMISLACDVGGTFTDLVAAAEGRIGLYKAPTTPDDPVEGVLAAIALAAAAAGLRRRDYLAGVGSFVHATTRAINAVLTGTTARTAFLTTEGHRDILLLREGGRLNPYDNRQPFPRPYVPRALTFEVPERIGAGGEIVRPLDEAAVLAIVERLAAAKVAAVGVCLLWSIANPAHEEKVGALLARHLPGVAVTLSHRLNPIVREYRRASAACIDASLKPLMGRYLGDLARRLAEEGFAGRLLMVTSQGGVIDVGAAAEAPIHSLNSGPSMAPVAGRHFARLDAAGSDVIVADTGGTSYDVSLVRADRLPWTSETWLGPRFLGHMTGFPSVDVRSIGAGGGSLAAVDEGGLLRVGPESAGAEPGPACYGRGGSRPTVTDCALALGYLDPDFFLGGRLRLAPAAARRAIAQHVGEPLGLPVEAAAQAVLDLLTQAMVAAIEEITVNQGIDPRRAVLVAGGGAAGFNSAAIARRLGSPAALLPEIGAALSAGGALLSDLVFTDGLVRYVRSDAPDLAAVATALETLTASAEAFLAGPAAGPGEGRIDYWVEARYPQQTWEIEVPLPGPRLAGEAGLALLVEAFHAAHQTLYAVSDPASPVELIAWRVRAARRLDHGAGARLAAEPAAAGRDARRIHLPDAGWREVPLRRFAALPLGAPLAGPAIVESGFTTILVPPGSRATRLASGTLRLEG